MSSERVERKLAAILAADVAAYSRLVGLDEEGTIARLKAHRRELIDPKITQHGGRVVKTTGDGILIEFPSVVAALRCAVEVQRAMAERNAKEPADRRIIFRVGVHVGDVIIEDGDILGDGVNVAARLEGIAEPGSICISQRVHEDVAGRIDVAFENLGDQQLKNIARPIRAYSVRLGDAAAMQRPALALPDKPSIAVLPFTNMSGDPEQEYFADGMVEEIITALSRVKWFFVIARNSTFTYKGRAVDVKQVARELGVRYVLEGSVRRASDRVRITGQLIDGGTGNHIWADHFDGALDDIFELQDRITGSVVGAIEPKLLSAEAARARRKPTDSLDAYDCFLRAMPLVFGLTKKGSAEALDLLRRAIDFDPSYSSAYGLAAECYSFRRSMGWVTPEALDEEARQGTRLARKAVELGGDDPTALWTAACSLAHLAQDYDGALDAVDRSLKLNPSSASAYCESGWVRLFRGENDAAREHFELALRLSPFDPMEWFFYAGIARAYLQARRYDEAVTASRQSLQGNERWAGSYRTQAAALAQLGRISEAQQAIARLLEIEADATIAKTIRLLAWQDATIGAPMVEGLRKAGLPE